MPISLCYYTLLQLFNPGLNKKSTSQIYSFFFYFFPFQLAFILFQQVYINFDVLYHYVYNLFHQTYPYFLLAGRVHEDEVGGGQVEGAHGGVARAEPVQQLHILHL